MAEIRKAAERDVLPVAAIYEHIISEEEAGRVCIGWQRGVYPTEHTAREAIAAGELFVMADGGEIVAAGTPHEIACAPRSYTGEFLKKLGL